MLQTHCKEDRDVGNITSPLQSLFLSETNAKASDPKNSCVSLYKTCFMEIVWKCRDFYMHCNADVEDFCIVAERVHSRSLQIIIKLLYALTLLPCPQSWGKIRLTLLMFGDISEGTTSAGFFGC